MHRRTLLLATLALLGALAPVWGHSLTAEQRDDTIAFVKKLQDPLKWGFRPGVPNDPPTLSATLSAVRALHHLGEPEIPEQRYVGLFVISCQDPTDGGFSDQSGGKSDVRSTALGLMAMAELNQAKGERARKAAAYLEKNAKSLPEIYLAEAAMDSAKLKPIAAAQWLEAFAATRNADGTYGKMPADTASAAITYLRLGAEFKDREAAARQLKAAQRPDGGFSASGEQSDLPTVYRTMRALYMLKEKPDLAKLKGFLARCRNEDGGYGPQPGQPSTASATYNAAIVYHWIEDLEK
jgi:prenyltransferase beta subunit